MMTEDRIEKKPWKSSLGWKFIFLVAVILSVTMGISAFINYHTQTELHTQHIKSKGQTLGQFVASISPQAIYTNDFLTLNDYVREMSRQQDIVYTIILDKNGKPLTDFLNIKNPAIAASIKTLGIKSVSVENALNIVNHANNNHDVIALKYPIMFARERLGSVTIGLSNLPIKELTRGELSRQFIGSVSIIIVLSICIFIVFRYSALRSIRQLFQGSQRIARGDLDHQITVYNDDELGSLTRAFNEMMLKLKKSGEEKDAVLEQLQELNKTLETRIEDRTQALEHLNKELEHLALHDPLTALPNRALIQDRIRQAIHNAKRDNESFSIIMIDLDRFKEVNDTLGHHIGDQLLKEVGKRLKDALRDIDTVGRLGGDEFAIIIPHADRESSVDIASKLGNVLEATFMVEGINFSVGASMGIALYPKHGHDASNLLKCADVAMYVAKNNKSGYFIYDPRHDKYSPARLALMTEFRQTLDKRELFLHYQPIIDTASGRLHGVEALTRWRHPERGLIPPDEFIPLIEQTALIRPFTLWVIETALVQWKIWSEMGSGISMYVNLPMRNLHDPEFPAQISAILDRLNLTQAALVLEITENIVMDDPDRVLEILPRLGFRGISFAIDDFGTGYSSLSKLKQLPAQAVKIDHSFVTEMDTDTDDATIVHSTIDLAHNLGLKVIAEGVESEAALEMLKNLGCDMAQGFYISKPLSADDITAIYIDKSIEQSLSAESTKQ